MTLRSERTAAKGRCQECGSGHGVGHTPECSWAGPIEEREQFIRENAVSMVRKLESKIRNQCEEITRLHKKVDGLRKHNHKLMSDMGNNVEFLSDLIPDNKREAWKQRIQEITDAQRNPYEE